MKVKNLKKNRRGFTIIEVLIVLAIAGLIMLIVFLAVPALQRNSRNTQRKNEVASILGAISEYANNRNGVLPANSGELDAAIGNAKLNIYNGQVGGDFDGNANNPNNVTDVTVVIKGKCSGENAVAGSSRNLAVLYAVETGGGHQNICQES